MLACRPSGWWLFEVLGIEQEYPWRYGLCWRSFEHQCFVIWQAPCPELFTYRWVC